MLLASKWDAGGRGWATVIASEDNRAEEAVAEAAWREDQE